jgi:hypothetical protein
MALHDQLDLDFAMVTPGAKTAPNAFCAQLVSTAGTKRRTFIQAPAKDPVVAFFFTAGKSLVLVIRLVGGGLHFEKKDW